MQTEPKVVPQINYNNNLPTIFIDGANIGLREDGVCFISFVANLPFGNMEQARIMTTTKNLKKIVDGICKNLNYYPMKPSEPKVTAKIQRNRRPSKVESRTTMPVK